jgi:tRNA-(ms[2]io[6]A)-hydroxylase
MLGLKMTTDPRWVGLAERSIHEILSDHAYCEQKAASTCIGLIQLYPDRNYLVDQLTPVVTEEWAHFRMVLEEIKKRNLKLGQQRKDEYAMKLIQFHVKGGREEERFLDRILMSALIEARSCERFRLLSLEINDIALKQFYHKLMVAEANHYRLFIDIAEHYVDKDKVKKRWNEWVEYEAEILQEMELKGDRMH